MLPRFVNAVLSVLVLALLSAESIVWAQDCSDRERTVKRLRASIKADQDSIQRLNPMLTADELKSWADATEWERQDILKTSLGSAISTLVDGLADKVISAPENALKPMDIAGYHLPNGIGSLGTGQANAIIGILRRKGLNQTIKGKIIVSSIRELSSVSKKKGTLQFINQLAKTAKVLKGASEVQNSDDSVETMGALLQLVADLAGRGDFTVGLGTALFQGAKNEFEAYYISSAIGGLTDTSESQLDAVKSLDAKIQRDVQLLKLAQAHLEVCTNAKTSGEPLNPDIGRHSSQCPDYAQVKVCLETYLKCSETCKSPMLGAPCGSCSSDYRRCESAAYDCK